MSDWRMGLGEFSNHAEVVQMLRHAGYTVTK